MMEEGDGGEVRGGGMTKDGINRMMGRNKCGIL